MRMLSVKYTFLTLFFLVIISIGAFVTFGQERPSVTIDIFSAETESNISGVFFGDAMFDRGVRQIVERRGGDYNSLFAEFEESKTTLLQGVDFVSLNLEGVVGPHANPEKTYDFAFDEKILEVLNRNNISVVNLANNHSYDQGGEGFKNMQDLLRSAGIGFFGSQVIDNGPSWKTEFRGTAVEMLGFNVTNPSFDESIALESIVEA